MSALGAGGRVDDGIDQRRFARSERLGQRLGQARRVGHVVAGSAKRFEPTSLREAVAKGSVLFEKRPVRGSDGKPVAGLYNAWITLNNPSQFNSYTTDMVKGVILAFREAHPHRVGCGACVIDREEIADIGLKPQAP